ncbi:MAG TPA: hypothetical protein VL916_11680, partial [Ilumatobacteraceae bacterium]|nr:hypothetical protein [Ilumatobacteraceae bacterium]
MNASAMVASGVGVVAPVGWLLVHRLRRAHRATTIAPHRCDEPRREVVGRVVATGHDTPYSLARVAGMPSCRDRIVDLNRGRSSPSGVVWHGGVFPRGMEVLVPDELVAPSCAATSQSPRTPVAIGFGSAVLVSAGAVAVLERRRAHRLRGAPSGAVSSPPNDALVRAETLLRGLDGGARLVRLERAVRCAAVALADQGASIAAVLLGDEGDVHLFLRGAARAANGPWRSDGIADVWVLDAHVPTNELVADHEPTAWPCPALVHVGAADDGGICLVDLEVLGVLVLDTPFAASVLRHLAVSLEVSPFSSGADVITSGLVDASVIGAIARVDSLSAALAAASLAVGTTIEFARRAGTFALRVAGAGGDTWDPAIVVGAGPIDDATARALSSWAAPGSGLAAVVEGPALADVAWSLRWDGDAHVLEPLAIRLMPCGLDGDDVRILGDLLGAETAPLATVGGVVDIAS